MNATTVQIKGNQAACTSNSGDLIIRRCYQIDPTTPVSTTVRFWFTEAERNAQTANALRLWHWGPWTQVGTIANYSYSESGAACTSGSGQACWFQSTGVSTYSPFVLGSGSVPTAIHLIQLEAHSNAGWLILVTGAVLLTGVMLITIKFKRRRV
jgi:hypothetical protein